MKKKRAPWPRWAKILRNLLLAVLLGVMMWDMWNQPTFSYMTDLRRRERRALFPEPEAVAELHTAGGGMYRVEAAGDMAVTSYPARGSFFAVANTSFRKLKDGPDLFSLFRTVELPDAAGQPLTYAAYVAAHPPEGAAAAVLTLHNDDGDFTVEGVREGEFFFFFARPEPDEKGRVSISGSWFSGYTYEVGFSDGNGNLIQEISG